VAEYTVRFGPDEGRTVASRGARYYYEYERPKAATYGVPIRQARAIKTATTDYAGVGTRHVTVTRKGGFENVLEPPGPDVFGRAIRLKLKTGQTIQTRSWSTLQQARNELPDLLARYGIAQGDVVEVSTVGISLI
jgi:anaerobic selenocysteine-containing dehydrogenase